MYAYNVANGKKNVKCRRAKKDKISALWNENKKREKSDFRNGCPGFRISNN